MKLNIGCGEFPDPAWINMDLWVDVERGVIPNIVGSLLDLPDEIQNVTHVYMGHVLEHIPVNDLRGALPRLWERCLDGAQVAAVGPDVKKAKLLHQRGRIDTQTYQGAIHGACRWPGDEHHWACDEDNLTMYLKAFGLDARKVDIKSKRLDPFPVTSRAEWQCAAIGTVRK